MTQPERDGWTWLLAIFGIGNLANGVWMLASPPSWYRLLPAAVPDFGPLNEHFVRDIGSAFSVLGASLLWAAFSPRLRVPAIGFALAFNALHALGCCSRSPRSCAIAGRRRTPPATRSAPRRRPRHGRR